MCLADMSFEELQVKKIQLFEDGKAVVKAERQEDWQRVVEREVQDESTLEIFDTMVRMMQALSEGKAPKEVFETITKISLCPFTETPYFLATIRGFAPGGDLLFNYFLSKESPKGKNANLNNSTVTHNVDDWFEEYVRGSKEVVK